MKTTEIVLLALGSVLFLFSIIMMVLLFKKDKPFIKIIWFLVLSFLMMGFSVIKEADVAGIFKYKKEQELSQLMVLSNALQECPDNEVIKKELQQKLKTYEEHDHSVEKPEDLEKIGKAYLLLGDEDKLISYSDKILSEDTTNLTAKTLKKAAVTQNMIKTLPDQINKRRTALKVKQNIETLKKEPTVDPKQIIRLENMYKTAIKKIADTVPHGN
ncbi:hypothetical protein D1818_23340 [Aquimarina sp. BL5]|uniref:hypothetical protein n=1 Tax=Aquimarina sp. BL5 TaxID=1714860 RepID=UPI000E535719|nr:hypothetical protein [Aquimarina sp. BL5]AXT53614.1 hypothetical protein D1818_23340 [Aquimarina sp. BL5]RKM97619.1 hypothetical protein D7036_20460 [Aquimarina sp. BL5]